MRMINPHMNDRNLDPRHLPPSLWAASAPPAPPTTPLPPGEHSTDLLVIGGGFTGLAAALHAAGRGARVMVLEAGEIGHGASGRNNGLVIPALTRADPDVLVQAFGAERGESVVELLRDSADTVFTLITRHRIACEAVQTGWVQPAHRPSRLVLARSRVEQWQRRGAPARLLDADEVAALTGSRFWCGGWIQPRGGHVNPLALARGIARAAIDAGAVVHTQSPASGLQRTGNGWQVGTPGGSVRARRVVMATHAYSGFLVPSPDPRWVRTMVPVRSYQMATTPLPKTLAATVLPSHVAMSDTQADLHFAHRDAHDRIVSGGALAVHADYETRLKRRIGARLLAMFPQLGELPAVRFDHVWHGVFAATPDKLPRFFAVDDGLVGWIGCNGRGVALATALGPVLADAALGDAQARSRLPFEAPRVVPGHAFSEVGVRVATVYYRWLDGRD